MPKSELLPGVTRSGTTSPRVIQSRSIITRARLRATLQDGAQLLLLGGVDWFFAQWGPARFPLFGRHGSLELLLIVNSAAITYIVMRRLGPRLRAAKIARTWSDDERERQATSAASRSSRLMTKR